MCKLFYLADDWIISGGDRVEDPFNALQRFLVAGGDAIKCFIVILKSTTAFTAPEEGNKGRDQHTGKEKLGQVFRTELESLDWSEAS